MCLYPQSLGGRERIYSSSPPPFRLVTAGVNLAMVTAAKWDRQFVAHLAPECPVLRKTNVMSVSRLPATYEAWLLGNKFDVDFVPYSARLWYRERALIDSGFRVCLFTRHALAKSGVMAY